MMDYFTKRNILIWALVILVVLNISTLATIWILNRSNETPAGSFPPADIEFRGVNHFIRNELGFSELQWQQFTELRQQHMQETQELMQEMHKLRQDMFNELASKNPGEKKLKKISQAMGETHGALKENSMLFFAEVNKLCDNDQKQQLNKLFQELKSMPENRDFGRPGGRHRRGHQWRNHGAPE